MHIYFSKNKPQILVVFLFFGLSSVLFANSSHGLYSSNHFFSSIPAVTKSLGSKIIRTEYLRDNLKQELSSYTLTDKDYAMVGNNGFSNFDIREGYEDAALSVRLDKINTILLHHFPNQKKGQKIAVSYNVWQPGDAVFVMHVIYNGNAYELQKEI
ncbi:hypothetical protein [Tenacibaculum sp. SG-28]|uniref:hypothetical protein n=1 Tax=Tenacibaculum sp. SG-28 TaxID=754426 RepID=UPI000CF37122|nr:hypothetical protein [Tenacibaculum sp. SG-28]PQJ21913.1 hypothetical protein BSU00_07745 [Tenacibaculum sp. SG-28]